MFIPQKDQLSNLWKVVGSHGGEVPACLLGFYTKESNALRDIAIYAGYMQDEADAAEARAIARQAPKMLTEAELWREAKLVTGMSSRAAYDIIKRKQNEAREAYKASLEVPVEAIEAPVDVVEAA